MLLFVYGSLLRGEANHAVIAAARFAGETRTAPHYTLVDLGPYPALREGGETAILGELYEVDAALLATLDDFEGHPDVYLRKAIELAGGVTVEAYVLPAARDPLPGVARSERYAVIRSGSWRDR